MASTRKIILASESPRRRDLLAQLGIPFEVVPSGIDEKPWPGETPASYALRNASDKARAVFARTGGLVLAADTIVVCDGHILEKPADAEHARKMLGMLSGRGHDVLTGLCLLDGERESARVVRTRVEFKSLTMEQINAYIATGEPMDKAGAYAIQGGAADFVARIEGSYSNVVGLPVEVLREMIGVTRDL